MRVLKRRPSENNYARQCLEVDHVTSNALLPAAVLVLLFYGLSRRQAHEDPMFEFMNSQKKQEQKNKLLWLQSLLDKESSSDGESSSESRDRGSKKKKKKKTRSKEKELWVERALSSNSASAADSSRSLGKKSKKHHKEKKNRKKDQRQRSSPLRKDHKDKKKRRKDGDNCPSSSPESSHKSKHKRPKRWFFHRGCFQSSENPSSLYREAGAVRLSLNGSCVSWEMQSK